MVNARRLCIATPFAGGRILEAGDEEIFRVVYGIGVLSHNWSHWVSILKFAITSSHNRCFH